MGTFSSERTFPHTLADLTPIGNAVMDHFRQQNYEVSSEQIITGGWCISITKGSLFHAVLGMQTALNVEITPTANGVHAKAGVGIFGKQVIPSIISLLFFWPVLLTQIWGLVQQAKLDDEALSVIEQQVQATPPTRPAADGKFCTACGQRLPSAARFCSGCGVAAEAS